MPVQKQRMKPMQNYMAVASMIVLPRLQVVNPVAKMENARTALVRTPARIAVRMASVTRKVKKENLVVLIARNLNCCAKVIFNNTAALSVGRTAVFFAQFSGGRLQATGLTCALCNKAIHQSLEQLAFVESGDRYKVFLIYPDLSCEWCC